MDCDGQDEDDESADEYSDDDDMSWKVNNTKIFRQTAAAAKIKKRKWKRLLDMHDPVKHIV